MVSKEEIEDCRGRLQECRSATPQDPKRILSIFEELSKKPISVEILHTTGIGKEVNDRFFKNHADQEVREHCTELVRKWKDFALGKSVSAAPAAAPAQNKLDSPPPRKPEKSVSAAPAAAPEQKKPDSPPPRKPQKRAAEKPAKQAVKSPKKTSGPNEELAKLFDELSSFEFKKGGTSKFAGVAYKNVAATLRGLDEKVISGKSIAHLKGVGKETVKKIDQYIETGSIERLEKYRNGED
ncbi:unnamed protein product [Symbiodinium sp. CCMP2456]|nr:unnamed protein product [Symbiodinium sp. CCMP2456]